MFKSKALTALTFAALLVTAAQGQAQTQPDAHHSQTGGATTQTAPTSQQPGMAPPDMMQMMQMMSGMMKMMGGGGQPGQMGMDGMGATEHNEGRIAFLRAELRITDAQSKAWDAFAALLRDNAKKMMQADTNMMPDASAPKLTARLDLQERVLAARLEAVRAMKAASGVLNDALTGEQRKILDELLATHMGLMPAGMIQGAMMQDGMAANR